MRLSDFQFDLPEDRIAQRPAPERERSRMLVLPPGGGEPVDARASDLPRFLRKGDLLVLNDSRVFPARLRCVFASGAEGEGLFIRAVEGEDWLVLIRPSRKVKEGAKLAFPDAAMEGTAIRRGGEGEWVLRVSCGGAVPEALERAGAVPLPPYIRRPPDEEDRRRYQTVYADEPGSVAAPTAGLHFTHELMRRLEEGGVGIAKVTLHVGPGTFRPVRTEKIEEHEIEPERYHIPDETARRIAETKRDGGRVVAVGTTTVRTLEGASDGGAVRPGGGWTGLYIHPPFEPSVIDALLTNFHLPGSSLFLLVCALAGADRMKGAYGHAVRAGYRFYSYGDCCLILLGN